MLALGEALAFSWLEIGCICHVRLCGPISQWMEATDLLKFIHHF